MQHEDIIKCSSGSPRHASRAGAFRRQRLGIKDVDEGFGSSASCTTISVSSTWSRYLAPSRQPVRPEVVTHVIGTTCHPCLRTRQILSWCRMQDLNPRPSVYKTAALPAELIRHANKINDLAFRSGLGAPIGAHRGHKMKGLVPISTDGCHGEPRAATPDRQSFGARSGCSS